MDEKIVQQILDEILSSLEPIDTHSAALLQFLKAKGIATDDELAPYLEQAGNASNVRWLAARVRIRSLISSAMKPVETKPVETKPAERHAETESTTTQKAPEPAGQTSKPTAQAKQPEPDVQSAQAANDNSQPEKPVPAVAENDENKKESKAAKSNEATNQDAA